MVARYQQVTARFTGRIRVGISLFFALIAGIGVSAQWKEWILFTHRVDFGVKDPQFHKDVGFYVFQLPFIQFMLEWLFAGLVIVLLVTAVAHYLNGGIRFQSPVQRVTPQVKAHLSVILAVMALVKTAAVLLRALRAELLEPRCRRRRGLHRCARAAARARAAHLHLGRRRAAVHLEHPPAGLGAARHRGRPVGLHLAHRRHDLPGRCAELQGQAERVRERVQVHRAQHRRHACRVQPQQGRREAARLLAARRPRTSRSSTATGPRSTTRGCGIRTSSARPTRRSRASRPTTRSTTSTSTGTTSAARPAKSRSRPAT